MHKSIKLGLYSLLAFVSWHYISLFCKAQTDGFSVARVQSDLPYDSKWEVAPPSDSLKEEMKHILSQPFHYLGRGGQCFAFVSEDQQYVIKFFKHRFYKPYEILLQLPLPRSLDQIRKRKMDKILFKIDRDCTSYKIAYEEIPQETGLVYLHLHPKEGFEQSVSIIDKLGITHTLSLNKMAFILQKRAEPVPLHLKRLMEAGDKMASRKAIHAILETIISCSHKGIMDDDPGLHRNFGFIEDKPMFIDVGRFKRETAALSQQDLKKITMRFRSFLKSKYPELVTTLDEEIDAIQTDKNI